MFPSQIKTLEERRLSLPAASSFPRRTTGNEVDTPQPTPAGPPSHQPAGACPLTLTTHANVTPKSLISSLLQAEAPQGPWAHRGFPVLMDLPVRLEEKESLEQSVKHTRRTSTLVLLNGAYLPPCLPTQDQRGTEVHQETQVSPAHRVHRALQGRAPPSSNGGVTFSMWTIKVRGQHGLQTVTVETSCLN